MSDPDYFLPLVAVFVILIMRIYLSLAIRYRIIDTPNVRSSHEHPVIRGGGIVFYFAILFYSLYFSFPYPHFLLSLTVLSAVSFLDDLITVPPRVRAAVHFLGILVLISHFNGWQWAWYTMVISTIIAVGVLNAYNFMDGINGITGIYSLVVIGSLAWINTTDNNFIDQNFLWTTMVALVVFGWYNFRNKARCFAGDVGSIAVAAIIIFALGMLIQGTNYFPFLLFLAVYGVDSTLTIIRRLFKKENIFKAHRSHLYQHFANIGGVSHLKISLVYGIIQLIVNLLIYVNYSRPFMNDTLLVLLILGMLSAMYFIFQAIFARELSTEEDVQASDKTFF